MTRIPSLAALALAAVAFSPLAQAQYDQPIGQPLGQPYGTVPYEGPTYGSPTYGTPAYGSGQTITCESRDGGFQECGTPFRGRPVIAETLSSAACIEGQTWGTRGVGPVWVMNGCRARFADTYGGQAGVGGYGDTRYSVRCESDEGRERECQAPVQTRLTLLRQISDAPCIEGQTWGSTRNGRVWVRGGCRGDFGPAQGWGGATGYGQSAGTAFRCESQGGRHQECRAPVQGRQALLRQLSDTACVEGQTWGSREGGVWVRGGCRGEFGPAQGWGTGGWGQPVGGYGDGSQITCSSDNQRYNVCAWNSRWGYPRLLEQLSQDACLEGSTWGYDNRGQIWVDRGCRGRFGAR